MEHIDKRHENTDCASARGTDSQAFYTQHQMGIPNPEVVRKIREYKENVRMGRAEGMKPSPEPSWRCSCCGNTHKGGKFCTECGAPRPVPYEGKNSEHESVCPGCGVPAKGDAPFCEFCGTLLK